MVFELSDFAIQMAESGVRSRYPNASEREIFAYRSAAFAPGFDDTSLRMGPRCQKQVRHLLFCWLCWTEWRSATLWAVLSRVPSLAFPGQRWIAPSRDRTFSSGLVNTSSYRISSDQFSRTDFTLAVN